MSMRLVSLLLLLAAQPAAAFDVYVNGVKVTGGLSGQTFRDVTVHFAENGDIQVDAPGYKVEVEGPAQGAPMAAGRYWFFLDAKQVNQYRVSLLVNGKPAADVPATSNQWVADLGPFLQPGTNQLQVTFLPQPGARGTGEAISILVGEGVKGADGTLTISKVLQSLKVDAGKQSAEAWPMSFTLP